MLPTSRDSLAYIDKLELFAGLDEKEKRTLSVAFRPRGLLKGEVLCEEGAVAESFFITAVGTIGVYKELGARRQELLSRVGPDNVLGQVALIDRQARSATLKAETSALVLECKVVDFERMFSAGTPFAYKLMDMIVTELARRLRDADQRLNDLYSHPMETMMRLQEAAAEIGRVANDQDRLVGRRLR